MKTLIFGAALLGISPLASAIETETEATGASGSDSEGRTVYTLSQWIEDNGGQAAVDIMLAQEAEAEAEAEAKQNLQDNPEEAAALKEAAKAGMKKCEDTQVGAVNPLGGPNYSDSDVSVSVSIPLDDFFNWDWSDSRISIGSNGYGVTTKTGMLFSDPYAVGACVQTEIDKAVDKIIEERDKLMSGDFSTVKKALAAAAVGYLIDEARDYDSELGEMLDTLEKICTSGGNCF
jgi:hypothetical protein